MSLPNINEIKHLIVASLEGRRGEGRTAPGDTLQGGNTGRKKIVGKFTNNSG